MTKIKLGPVPMFAPIDPLGDVMESARLNALYTTLKERTMNTGLTQYAAQALGSIMPYYNGERIYIACNGTLQELPEGASMEQATEAASAIACKCGVPAFILKPVKKVAPKRDVVVTDLG